MKRDESEFLEQLVNSADEAVKKLEEAYKNKDHKKFDEAKKFIIKVQAKISELTR